MFHKMHFFQVKQKIIFLQIAYDNKFIFAQKFQLAVQFGVDISLEY